MDFTIRSATHEDCKDIMRMVSELAEYENISDQVMITLKDLEQDGFSQNPGFRTAQDQRCWKGRAVFMEDLYVMPEFRAKGIGKALMCKVAQLGQAAGCTQLKFTVLNWNKSALDFYQNQGSTDLTSEQGYHYMCCHGDAFQKMADRGC